MIWSPSNHIKHHPTLMSKQGGNRTECFTSYQCSTCLRKPDLHYSPVLSCRSPDSCVWVDSRRMLCSLRIGDTKVTEKQTQIYLYL